MHKKNRFLPSPVRIRREPPTVAEAVAAAQTLTPDLEQKVDITARLTGLPLDGPGLSF
jgi:protein involved in polysaccharide export with SLBB domain